MAPRKKAPVKRASTPKQEVPKNSILRKDLIKAYRAFSCDTWRSNLKQIIDSNSLADDSEWIEIPRGMLLIYRSQATPEQKAYIDNLGLDIKEDLNPFVGVFDSRGIKDVANMLFGKGGEEILQIARDATPYDRPDLKGRAFYVHYSMEVILHKGSHANSTIIELRKR